MPQLKDLKKGEYFKKTESGKSVYVKGHYDRASKKFSCCLFDDMNHEVFISATKDVFTNFEF